MKIIRGKSRTWDGAMKIALSRYYDGWGKHRVWKVDGWWWVS